MIRVVVVWLLFVVETIVNREATGSYIAPAL